MVVALMVVANMSVRADETLAKGCLYAWSAVMLADGATPNEELGMFTTFAKVNTATKDHYSDKFLASGFEESIIAFKQQGMDALVKKIVPMLKGAKPEDRGILLVNFFMLAKADGDFSAKEQNVISSIVKAVNFSRDEVLTASMVYASR